MTNTYEKKDQNKTNSENGHLGFSIFKKNKKTTESVIFRLYFKDIVKPIDYITNSCAIYLQSSIMARCRVYLSSDRPPSGDQRMPTSDVTIGTGGRRGAQ